jgi:uncharacterized Zn-binding protein involved in type VI secretion
MEALGAARLGDQVGHGVGVAGMLIGALAGVALGLAALAAAPLVLTGGAAVLLATATMGSAVAGGALAVHQLVKGVKALAHWPDPPTGALSFGSINVNINGRSAIRATVDPAACSGGYGIYFSHPPFSALVAAGSKTVRVNGRPAARITMPMTCGAKITSASEDVSIGGPTEFTETIYDIAAGAEFFFEVMFLSSIGGGVAAATWGGVLAGMVVGEGLIGGMIGFGEAGGAIAVFAAAFEGLGLVGEMLLGEGGRDFAQGLVGVALLPALFKHFDSKTPQKQKTAKPPPDDNDKGFFGSDDGLEPAMAGGEGHLPPITVERPAQDRLPGKSVEEKGGAKSFMEGDEPPPSSGSGESGPSPLDTLPPDSKVIATDPNGKWVVFEEDIGWIKLKRIRFQADEARVPFAPSKTYNGTDEALAALTHDGTAYVLEGRHRVVAAAEGAEIPPDVGGVPGFPGWLQYAFESLKFKSGSGVRVRDLLPKEEITYVKEGGDHHPLVSPLSEREKILEKLYGPDSDSLSPAERQALEDKLDAPQPTGPRVKTRPLDQAKPNNGGDEPFNEASPPPPFEMETTLGTPEEEYGISLDYTDQDGVLHSVNKMSKNTGDPESLSANDDGYPVLAEKKQRLREEEIQYEKLREEARRQQEADYEEYKKRAHEEPEEQGYEYPPDLYRDATMKRRGEEFLESLEESGRISPALPSDWPSEHYIREDGIPTIISSDPVRHARLLDGLKEEMHRMFKEKNNVNEGKDYNFYEGDPYGNLDPYSDHWRPVKKPIYYKDADGVFRPLGDLAKADTMDVGNTPILSTNDPGYKGGNDMPSNVVPMPSASRDGKYPSETE